MSTAANELATLPQAGERRFITMRLATSGPGVLHATLSSELPYNRDGMDEILVHTSEAVNLERAQMGLPLLIDHDMSRQLGRVENIRLNGRKLVGDIRLSDREDVAGIVADIRSGIRPDISISYTIQAIQVADDRGSYQVTSWTPFEVSSVSCPADFSVGIGRSHSENSRKVLTMNAITTTESASGQRHDPIQGERERIANINAMGARLKAPSDLMQRAVNEGWSTDKFIAALDEATPPARAIRAAEGPVVDDRLQREINQYSLSRAVACQINNRFDGREAEVNQELARRYGITPRGFLAPFEVLQSRAQQVGTANIGGNLVGTDYLADQFIQPFRNSAAVMGLGATVIRDLVGNIELPRQESTLTGQWIAEDSAPSETTLNFGKLGMTPKTVAGYMSWSRQAALQALPSMEEMLRAELETQLGLGLDLAAVKGVGSATEPRGILNTSGVGSVVGGANGSAPDYNHIIDLETAVANQNATGANMGYLTNTKVRGKLKKTQMVPGTSGELIWGRDNRLNGYATAVSNQVPANLTKGTSNGVCSAIIFGNWRDLVIGFWSYVDIIVDPYTYSTQGKVRISGFLSADITVKHPESFSVMADALTN